MVAKLPNRAIQSKPSAWIVTNNQKDKSKPSDRGRKSIKNGKVYLQDGQEFEIELHNPLQECVLCDIKLNGQSISKNGLVLRPAERFYLDCFVDDKKKFIFKTYEVESSEESEKAIEKNGVLEVFFYKESTLSIKDWRTRFDRVIIERYPVYYPYYDPYWYPYRPTIIYGGTTTIGTGGYGVLNSVSTNTVNLTNNNITTGGNYCAGTTLTSNSIGGSYASGDTTNMKFSNSSYTTNLNVSNVGGTLTSNISPINASIETGRVEKGTSSSQKFTEVDMDFDNNYIASTIIQILPESRKPVETKDIKKPNLKDILKRESDEVIDLIKKLADLHSAGILTDEEFNTKKAELLSKI